MPKPADAWRRVVTATLGMRWHLPASVSTLPDKRSMKSCCCVSQGRNPQSEGSWFASQSSLGRVQTRPICEGNMALESCPGRRSFKPSDACSTRHGMLRRGSFPEAITLAAHRVGPDPGNINSHKCHK